MCQVMLYLLIFIFSSPLMGEAIRLGKCYEIPGQVGTSYAPTVAMNASHAAVIMWENSSSEGNAICVDFNCNKSSWGWIPSEELDLSGSLLRLMQCSVDDSNRSHHLWVTERKQGKYQFHLAEGDLQAKSIQKINDGLSGFSFDPSHYRIALRKNGELFLVRFLQEGGENPKFTLQEFSSATGGFITIAPPSKNHYFHRKIFLDQCAIAASPNGSDCVVWEEQAYPRTQIHFSEKHNVTQWSSPYCLYTSPKGGFLSDLKLAVGKELQAAVVWVAFSHAMQGRHVYGMVRNAQGDWSVPKALVASAQEIVNLNVMVDPKGNALAVWEVILQGYHEIWSVYKSANQDWEVPICLSQSPSRHQTPQIHVSGLNRFVVLWQENRENDWCVHSRIYDGSRWLDDQVLSLGLQSRQPSCAIEGTQGIIAWLKGSSDGSWKVNYAHLSVY